MDALQQRVEVETAPAGVGDHDLAVDDASLGKRLTQRSEQLGEVAAERAELAGDQLHAVAVAEHHAPEAVPLGFEQPAVAVGNRPRELGQHGLQRRLDRQSHRSVGTGRGRICHARILVDLPGAADSQ